MFSSAGGAWRGMSDSSGSARAHQALVAGLTSARLWA